MANNDPMSMQLFDGQNSPPNQGGQSGEREHLNPDCTEKLPRQYSEGCGNTDGSGAAVLGTIVTNFDLPPATACWHCQRSERMDELFKPCACEAFIHRDCFRKWRTGWINPRNYFQCPNCCHSYRMERVKAASTDSKERILRSYRVSLIKLWLGTLLFIGGFVALLATIAYFSDRSEKNVPVAIKFMLTSAVSGFPNSNSTAEWRDNFRKPDVFVWQYYTLLAMLITSIIVLIGFCLAGCTFDENERRHQNCCADCCKNDSSGASVWWCYCYDPCPRCNCNTNCVGGCKDCSGCGGGDCKGGGDLGQALVILVVVIVVVVILSAIVVVILYTIQKWSLLYDRVTHMLLAQAEELEGETVVLAVNETWRPVSEV